MKTFLIMSLLAISINASAQKAETIKLWTNNMPNSNEITTPEKVNKMGHISNISSPEIFVFKAKKTNGMAIIMCPGGGYGMVSMNNEGYDMAKWLNDMGVTYVILKYRMPNGHYDVPLSDAKQAIKIVRSNAKKWNIDRVGIMGASAGGHLASTLATHYTQDTRPDFQILFYPVITMDKRYTHMGTHNHLFGKDVTTELENEFSNEKHVTSDTPPAFIMHCSDDSVVPVENSLNYYKALVEHKVSASLHIYPKGGHGWGYADRFIFKKEWKEEMEKWLEFINK